MLSRNTLTVQGLTMVVISITDNSFLDLFCLLNFLNLYVAVELDRRGCEIKISGTISLEFVLVRMS